MAKISRQVKEIIQIVVFFLIVGVLLYFYVIYPLGKTKAIMARGDVDNYDSDSLLTNNPTIYVEAGLAPDTFRIESDGLTNLACLYLPSMTDSLTPVRGTVFLVHDEKSDRNAMLSLSQKLSDSGFAIIVYDQRASGYSSGKYHGEGQYEASDIVELIGYLNLRERIVHPLSIVGYSLGGEAALLAALDEKRIDRVIAVNPYLSTQRMMNIFIEKNNLLWFPFRKTMFWWWYNIRSSYAASQRGLNDIEAVASQTLIFIPQSDMNDKEVTKIKELSDIKLLEIKATPESSDVLENEIITALTTE